MTSRFRRAGAPDTDAILALMAVYYAEEGYPLHADGARRAVESLLADERLGALWVAELGGYVAGYFAVTLGFSLEFGGRDAFLDELFVQEGARGRGLGAEAVELAEAWCGERGVRALHLEVGRHRAAALAMYRRHGFVERDRHVLSKSIDAG